MKSINLIKPYFVKKRVHIIIGLVCLLFVDLLQLVIPRIVKRAVDDLAIFQASLLSLFWYAFYIVLIAVIIAVLRYIWRIYLMGMSRELEQGLRNRLFSHIQTLSASYFLNVKTGDLMAHATNDIHHIRMASGLGMVAIMDAVVLGIITIGFMAYINIILTIFVVIPMPFIVFSARFFSKKMHLAYQNVQKTFADMTEVIRERFAGIRIIKAYNQEAESFKAMEKISKVNMKHNLKLARIMGLFFPMMIFFSNISLAVILYLGGKQTIYKVITPGDFVAFISYLGMMTWPMMAMGWVVNLIQRGKASLERLDKIFQTIPEIKDFSDKKIIKNIDYENLEIVLENIYFSYKTNNSYVLENINIKLKKGNTLGIIGPPGSGKTSLLNLIPRIFDPSKGRVLINNIDICNVMLSDIRKMIAFVPQEPFLFAGTIKDNISFGNPDISEQDLIQAVKQACVYNAIKSFPKGFDTIVGEKGIILSGGQKQRIALARALICQCPVLILDDPISQVDAETGVKIINTIQSMKQKQTIIIVSHRLSAVRFADEIITLADGKVIESGSHDKLMSENGYYSRTCKLQEIEEEFHVF